MLGNPMMDGGGVTLQLCGAPRRLRFDWNALGALRAKHGPEFQTAINSALVTLDFDVLAETLSLASGGVDAEQIKRDPPALVDAVKAVYSALNLAFHGPDGPPKEDKRPFVERARETLRSILSRMLYRLG